MNIGFFPVLTIHIQEVKNNNGSVHRNTLGKKR